MSTFALKKGITHHKQDKQTKERRNQWQQRIFILVLFTLVLCVVCFLFLSLCFYVCLFWRYIFRFFGPFRFVSVLVFFCSFLLCYAVLQIVQNRCTWSFRYENVICKARATVEGSVKEKAETFYVKLTNQPKRLLLTITSKSMLENMAFQWFAKNIDWSALVHRSNKTARLIIDQLCSHTNFNFHLRSNIRLHLLLVAHFQ